MYYTCSIFCGKKNTQIICSMNTNKLVLVHISAIVIGALYDLFILTKWMLVCIWTRTVETTIFVHPALTKLTAPRSAIFRTSSHCFSVALKVFLRSFLAPLINIFCVIYISCSGRERASPVQQQCHQYFPEADGSSQGGGDLLNHLC